MPATIACVSPKGGVGRTTTCIGLAGAWAETGRRVLLVDMDPKADLTAGLGIDPDTLRMSVADALIDDSIDLTEVLLPTRFDDIRILPAAIDLADVTTAIPDVVNPEMRLERVLSAVAKDFDVILIDTPPSRGFHTTMAMLAAGRVIIPVEPGAYAMRALHDMLKTLLVIRERFHRDIELLGVVPTFVDRRSLLARDLLLVLRAKQYLHVFSPVPASVELQAAAMVAEPITVYSSDSGGARAYRRLAAEISSRL